MAPDYHVVFEHHYYSVPYGLRGEEVEIRATPRTLEVFFRGHRVASHPRSNTKYQHTTDRECVGVERGVKRREEGVVPLRCDPNAPDQRWSIRRTRQNLVQIIAAESGKCLDVSGGSRDDGARVILWPCKPQRDNANQLWRVDGPPERASLVASHSGSCLDVARSRGSRRGEVIQSRCGEAESQRFELKPIAAATAPPARPIDAIVGDWDWFNEVTVSILADGTMHGTNAQRGTWRIEDPAKRVYLLSWDAGWRDRLTLAGDANELSGTNNLGSRVGGRRKGAQPARPVHPMVVPVAPIVPVAPAVVVVAAPARDCGTGPDDPGCNTEKNGKLPADAETFGGVVTAAKAQRSQISRRQQILAMLGGQMLTARQYGLVLDLFNSEIDRMAVAKGLVKNVVDPNRALGFAQKWRSSINQRDYSKMISKHL